MALTKEKKQAAVRHLRKCDPVMRQLIDSAGPFKLTLQRERFTTLARSIISQQISTAAARTIRGRLEALLEPGGPTPEKLAQLSTEELRSVGVSGQKARYLLDLSEKVITGDVNLRAIGRLTDEAVIDELIQVKGIGRWTAQMFLIFSLGRLDIFPHDDLGVRSAIRKAYELDELPNRQTSHQIAEPWRPYASVASWYLWRSVD